MAEQMELRQTLGPMTPRAARTLEAAALAAKRHGQSMVSQAHLLLGICEVKGTLGAKMLVDLGLDLSALAADVEAVSPPEPSTTAGDDGGYSEGLTAALLETREQASRLGHTWIGVEHFVLGLLAVAAGDGHDFLVQRGVTLDAADASCARLLPGHVAGLHGFSSS